MKNYARKWLVLHFAWGHLCLRNCVWCLNWIERISFSFDWRLTFGKQAHSGPNWSCISYCPGKLKSYQLLNCLLNIKHLIYDIYFCFVPFKNERNNLKNKVMQEILSISKFGFSQNWKYQWIFLYTQCSVRNFERRAVKCEIESQRWGLHLHSK